MVHPRSESLLWVQLISLGALPLEALLLLLLLAGADPGPAPLLERLLTWALGALAPALLLWQHGDHPLLPLAGTAAPGASRHTVEPIERLLFVAGVASLLPLLIWLDRTAALASRLSPVQGSGRLGCLVLAAAQLALMVWQWHRLVQAVWLLSRRHNQSGVAPGPAPEASAEVFLDRPVAIKPEQPPKQDDRPDLDQQVAGSDLPPGS